MDPRDNDPLDYLKLLWPDSLVDLIVVETNRYAAGKPNIGKRSARRRCGPSLESFCAWDFIGCPE